MRESEPQHVVVLSDKSPLSYARFVMEIARYDDCMLADPFFQVDNLPDILEYTNCTRILTRDSQKSQKERIAGLSVALKNINPQRGLQIRVSRHREFHDRYIITPSGPILAIGTSVNGVGTHFSVLVEIDEPVASLIRDRYREFWDQAEVLC